MDEDKKQRLCPGDVGYPGGETISTLVIDGKSKEVRIRKDGDGNIVFMSVTDKIFGIF